MSELFNIEKPPKTPRKSNREELKALKEKHHIYTHHCVDIGWMAISIPECVELLDGHDLNAEEKEDGMLLMIGYCRLIEEAGLLVDGEATEFAAVQKIAKRIEASK